MKRNKNYIKVKMSTCSDEPETPELQLPLSDVKEELGENPEDIIHIRIALTKKQKQHHKLTYSSPLNDLDDGEFTRLEETIFSRGSNPRILKLAEKSRMVDSDRPMKKNGYNEREWQDTLFELAKHRLKYELSNYDQMQWIRKIDPSIPWAFRYYLNCNFYAPAIEDNTFGKSFRLAVSLLLLAVPGSRLQELLDSQVVPLNRLRFASDTPLDVDDIIQDLNTVNRRNDECPFLEMNWNFQKGLSVYTHADEKYDSVIREFVKNQIESLPPGTQMILGNDCYIGHMIEL